MYLLRELGGAHLDVDEVDRNFKSTEKYIKHFNQVFKLVAFRPFESAAEALCQMNALSKSIVTEQLKNFLMVNLPTPIIGKPSYSVLVSDPIMSEHVCRETKMAVRDGGFFSDIARGLRTNIDKLIHNLEPGDLEKAQRDLACGYSRQICNSREKENSMDASSSLGDAVIVPHKFEGVFIAMGKDRDAICTKNLVPGEAVYGEEFVSAQNEDGTETEYRVWSHFSHPWKYRMLVGMVDVVVADTASSDEALFASVSAAFFLKAGGHFMISGQASFIYSTSNDKDMFAFLGIAKKA